MWTREMAIRKLDEGFVQNPMCVMNRVDIFGWESDYISKSSVWNECCVVLSVDELQSDLNHRTKQWALSGAISTDIPERFWYVVPDTLAMDVAASVPWYAGLVSLDLWTSTPTIMKEAPLLPQKTETKSLLESFFRQHNSVKQ